MTTDLYKYSMPDAVPPIHAVSSHVATNKGPSIDGGKFKFRKTDGRRIGIRFPVFTALHGMQTQSSDENSVRLSVLLSVTRVDCDKMVERSVQIYIPYERTFILVF